MTVRFGEDAGINCPYLVSSVLAVVIYVPLAGWVAFWIGMMARSRFRAIISALGVIVAWCVLPLIIFAPAVFAPVVNGEWRNLPRQLSPAFIVYINEEGTLDGLGPLPPWLPITLNFAFYGLLLFLIRRHCLRRADAYLRR